MPVIRFPEEFLVRLPRGTRARMDAALGRRETFSDLIRAGVETELQRREGLAGEGR